MTNKERKILEHQISDLISNINNYYEHDVSTSVMELHGGSTISISSWELEALLDDLLTIENDCT